MFPLRSLKKKRTVEVKNEAGKKIEGTTRVLLRVGNFLNLMDYLLLGGENDLLLCTKISSALPKIQSHSQSALFLSSLTPFPTEIQ